MKNVILKKFIKKQKNFLLLLREKKADANNVSQVVWILIVVVIGGLIIRWLYPFIGNDLLPTVGQKIKDILNFQG